MSPGKEKIFYCVPSKLDGLRHTPKALKGELEYLVYGEGVKYFSSILNALSSKKTILLNGFRFCDRYIAYIGLYLGCKVIILQHGRNEYFESRNWLLMIRKIFTESRYKYELLFLFVVYVWFSSFRIKRRKLEAKHLCKLLYFTDSYKDLWIKSLKKLNANIIDMKVNPPNPTTWGTEKPIARIHSLPVFLIDEPLDVTIGMSDERFFKLIDELLVSLSIEKMYTKRHPRSNVEKFKTRPNIIEIDEVPKNANVLIGYKSNLLFCGIYATKFYQFKQDSLKEASTIILESSGSLERRDYCGLSKEDFISL